MSTARRAFLKQAVIAATVLGGARPGPASAEPADLDVAIVGGGVSGAYAAWRLATAAGWDGRRIELFEMSGRIGGRLFSPLVKGMPHLRAELGGMRFVVTDEAATVTERLIAHLDLETLGAPVGGPSNLFYLRGRRFRAEDIGNPAILPYALPPSLAGKTPVDILLDAIQRVVPDAAKLSDRQWRDRQPGGVYQGKPWMAWSLLELLIQPTRDNDRLVDMDEAYQFVRDALGYYTLVGPWNLANAMPWMIADFVATRGYRTIRSGMQALPLELAARFQRQGGRVACDCRLRRIDRTEPGHYVLTFSKGDNSGEQIYVTAAQVILAMPPRSLALLDADSMPFQESTFRRDMRAVTANPMAKLFLGFNQPWWRDPPLGIRGGRSITDLPIRQTYYFGTEGEQPGADPTDRQSLLMASYDDGSAYEYWASFSKADAISGGPFWTIGDGMVDEVRRQLGVLHGVPTPLAHNPDASLMADWGRDPFGGAYHTWNVGERSWEVMPRIRKPLPGPLFVCGEAWSSDQGWINGALQTAERMLQEHFALDQPNWLPESVPLGA